MRGLVASVKAPPPRRCRGVRSPDRAERRDPAALELGYEAGRGRRVAHDEDGLRAVVAVLAGVSWREIRLAALRRVPDERVGLRRLDLVDQRVAVRGARAPRRPHEPGGDAGGEDLTEARPDPAAGHDVQDALIAAARPAPSAPTPACRGPDVRRRVVDEAAGPVPAREISSRKPGLRGVVTVANACHSRSGLRLMPTADANAGVTPWSNETSTACEEGRSTVTGTRRRRSHGDATLAVSSARIHTRQPRPGAG